MICQLIPVHGGHGAICYDNVGRCFHVKRQALFAILRDENVGDAHGFEEGFKQGPHLLAIFDDQNS